jgi:ribonuclease-3
MAASVIKRYILTRLPKIIEEGSFQDSKSKFQEYIQEKEGVTPIYKVLEESGPDHDRYFLVGVYVNEKIVGKGSGSSKRKAEQEAAREAVDFYKI